MLDSTQINVIDTTSDDGNSHGAGGTYYWRYVNESGCRVKDSVEMNVSARPQLAVLDLDTICYNGNNVDLIDLVNSPNQIQFKNGGPLSGWSGPGVVNDSFFPFQTYQPLICTLFRTLCVECGIPAFLYIMCKLRFH